MKILVTGGAGFIGSHLAKKLVERGDEVVIVDNFNSYYEPKLKHDRIEIFLRDKKFKLYKIDIVNFEDLGGVFKRHKFDKIVHLAAQAGVRYSLTHPFVYLDTNITGTVNLLELCKKYGVNDFVYASSSSVYGGNKKIPFSECDRVDQPISLYAASKKADELMAHTYHHLYKINCVGLRFFTVYGPWGRPDMALFKFTKNILAGRQIEVYGQGKMNRDFTFIDDIIAGILLVLDKNFKYEIFNLGNSHSEKLLDFINLIEKNLGKKAKIKLMPMQMGDVRATAADICKAKKILGWRPKTRILEGIGKFVEWYKTYYKLNQ